MNKVTVLYGHPTDPDAFEKYYGGTHMPLVGKIQGVDRAELTRFGPGPDGAQSEYYRMAEMYFGSPEQMQKALGSAEGQAAVADIPNFATGGVKMLMGNVEG
jgi:uncharacterized protein (TIGR02118 family)